MEDVETVEQLLSALAEAQFNLNQLLLMIPQSSTCSASLISSSSVTGTDPVISGNKNVNKSSSSSNRMSHRSSSYATDQKYESQQWRNQQSSSQASGSGQVTSEGCNCCCHSNGSANSGHDRGMMSSPSPLRLLNDAWELAGVRSRQRMALMGRHYRRLYRNYQSLRKRYHTCRRALKRRRHLGNQHQILLESIGRQVDDLTDEIASRNKAATAFESPEEDANNTYYSYCDYSTLLASVLEQSVANDCYTKPGDNYSESTNTAGGPLHRWYSTLSFKLDCIRTAVFLLFSLLAALRHRLHNQHLQTHLNNINTKSQV